MANNGWVRIHKKMMEWEWYDDPNTKSVFLDLILGANYRNTIWHNVQLKRGDVVTGRKELSKRLGISEQSIRTSINRLKSTNEITIKSTNKFSIVSVVNYDKYQINDDDLTSKSTSKLTNNQPATNQQLTTAKEYKNNNNKNNNNISPYPLISSIGNTEVERIATTYQVPPSYVRSRIDDMENWMEATGKSPDYYKNYYRALCDWVKKDSLKIKQDYAKRTSDLAL